MMAVPIEAANIYFRGTPIDSAISFGPISLEKLLLYQFKIIHWPGLIASDWFERIGFLQIGFLATVAIGYLDTVLLLIAVTFLFDSLRPRGARHPAQPDDPAEE